MLDHIVALTIVLIGWGFVELIHEVQSRRAIRQWEQELEEEIEELKSFFRGGS